MTLPPPTRSTRRRRIVPLTRKPPWVAMPDTPPLRVDHGRIEAAVREILAAVGEDPDRDGLKQTPARVARAYAEAFAKVKVDKERERLPKLRSTRCIGTASSASCSRSNANACATSSMARGRRHARKEIDHMAWPCAGSRSAPR